MFRLLPAWKLKNWMQNSFFCYCWIFFIFFVIYFSSFAWIVKDGGKIHWNTKVHKSYVHINEKFVTLPLHIHRFYVPVLHILLTKKKIQFLFNGHSTGTSMHYALIYSSNCNDIHWFRYVFFSLLIEWIKIQKSQMRWQQQKNSKRNKIKISPQTLSADSASSF